MSIGKHGIDFIGRDEVFYGITATIEDDRYYYDEERFVTFGLLDGRVVSVAHTETAEVIRIISIRKATKREQALYAKAIAD
ncbi:MAG: BrnT family toxin [Gammaproteobacteria bacterium]